MQVQRITNHAGNREQWLAEAQGRGEEPHRCGQTWGGNGGAPKSFISHHKVPELSPHCPVSFPK